MMLQGSTFQGWLQSVAGPMATTGHDTNKTIPLRGMGLPMAGATSQIKASKGQVQKAELGGPQQAEDSQCSDCESAASGAWTLALTIMLTRQGTSHDTARVRASRGSPRPHLT